VQKDLLASKLKTRPDSDRPRATRPDLLLCEVVSRRRLEQVPELIVLTNSRSFENLKLKRKEKKRRREHVIYNKYNVCAR
jgi:hypothetical protein